MARFLWPAVIVVCALVVICAAAFTFFGGRSEVEATVTPHVPPLERIRPKAPPPGAPAPAIGKPMPFPSPESLPHREASRHRPPPPGVTLPPLRSGAPAMVLAPPPPSNVTLPRLPPNAPAPPLPPRLRAFSDN